MIKKFNWGHGIALFYILFVGTVALALISSFKVDHSLVVDDYYTQDLAYQKTYDKLQNEAAYQPLKINLDDQHIHFDFTTTGTIKGTIHFYRASDPSQDFNHTIDDVLEQISTQDMLKGKWTMKIDWTQDEKSFYKEETIYI